jgi:hypothetical protein
MTAAVILAALCDLLRGVMLVGLPVTVWWTARAFHRNGMTRLSAAHVRSVPQQVAEREQPRLGGQALQEQAGREAEGGRESQQPTQLSG